MGKLEQLGAVCDSATPGPWYVGAVDLSKHTVGSISEQVAVLDFEHGDDADYIATFNPELVARLLAVVEAVKHYELMNETYQQDTTCDECREYRDEAHAEMLAALATLEAEQ